MSDTRYWEASLRTKLRRDMNPDEKAGWVKGRCKGPDQAACIAGGTYMGIERKYAP